MLPAHPVSSSLRAKFFCLHLGVDCFHENQLIQEFYSQTECPLSPLQPGTAWLPPDLGNEGTVG